MKRLSPRYYISILSLLCTACHEQAVKNQSTAVTVQAKNDSTWALLPFVKMDAANPVLEPGGGKFTCPVRKQTVLWEEKDVFNPALAIRSDTIYMLYRAQDKVGLPAGTSRIGLAASTDGIHFIRSPEPVLYPDNDTQKKYEWQGGCEDPRMVEDEKGRYYMTYSAYDGHTARLMVASSPDLRKWTKYGPAFAKAYQGKYLNQWSKSGSIVSRYDSGRIIAVKIQAKYWMYWGDQSIWLATSEDLIHWIPLEGKTPNGQLIPEDVNTQHKPDLQVILAPRKNSFDNDLVESGPPAIVTPRGILLIYNSRHISNSHDSSLPTGTYAAGQALFDKNDPSKLLQRTDSYFMKPDKPYEITGQVNNVCFLEGLANFKNKWWLYYGTADSKIAVASKP